MDRNRFSQIAHGQLPVWNPVGVDQLQRYVSQLELPEGGSVLDIGCGRGHLLGLILSQYKTKGLGVDSSAFAISVAMNDLAAHVRANRLTLVERAFDADEFGATEFDLVICIGSAHAAGGYQGTLITARRFLRAKGLLLVGEGFWKCTPSPDYLDFLKMTSNEHTTHLGNQSQGISEGFDLVSCSECSQVEWDAYEDQYARNIEEFVKANERDPDAEAMLQRIRPWREA
jgi:cyclopropane fatty-acyl-phospholipid synthase-like methyltransferase